MKRIADVPQLEPVCSRPRTAQADGVHAHKPDGSAQHFFPPPGCEASEWIGERQLILRQGSSLALMADVSEWLNRSQEFSEVSFLHLLHPSLSRALRPCKRTVGADGDWTTRWWVQTENGLHATMASCPSRDGSMSQSIAG
jgi:hypothetical protein